MRLWVAEKQLRGVGAEEFANQRNQLRSWSASRYSPRATKIYAPGSLTRKRGVLLQ
jgi:hypothetical protein